MEHQLPQIVVTSTLLEPTSPSLPTITLTREHEHQEPEQPTNITPSRLYPSELLEMAHREEERPQLEAFITSRLAALGMVEEQPRACRCSQVVACLEESLECPVCLEAVRGEVYQCYRGHTMCGGCRTRLWTCPVCRAALAGPLIRNLALERLARVL